MVKNFQILTKKCSKISLILQSHKNAFFNAKTICHSHENESLTTQH